MPDDIVILGDSTEREEESGGEGDEEDEPTFEELRDLVATLGYSMEWHRVNRECKAGSDWCGRERIAPVDGSEGTYNKSVLRVMNFVDRVNHGVATFFIRLPSLFRSRASIGNVVVDGRQLKAVLKPHR